MEPTRRAYAYAVSVLILGATVYPAFEDPGDDSFPLSTYPMFSRPKPRTVAVSSAVALGEGGFEQAVPPSYVANAEAMQALQTIKKSLRAGRRAAQRLCRAIAARIDAGGDPDFAQATEVALVTERIDSIAFLAGESDAGGERRVHVRCPIREPSP
ncbi:MAG: hypothetical protein PVI30_27910 [Myxococcales bacterium]|jgi:hypothetical protein